MPPTIYDLILVLSTAAPEERRAKILSDVETAISTGGGTIERNDNWGTRGLSYPIDHQTDAEYHLLQFGGAPPLLETLNHTLRITDGVLRFRIIKVLPGTPPAPDSPPPVVSATPAGAAASASAIDEQYVGR